MRAAAVARATSSIAKATGLQVTRAATTNAALVARFSCPSIARLRAANKGNQLVHVELKQVVHGCTAT